MKKDARTAKFLGVLAVGGPTLAARVWFLSFAPIPTLPAWARRILAVVAERPCSLRRNRRGGDYRSRRDALGADTFEPWIRNELWTEAELAPLRDLVANLSGTGMSWAALAVYAVGLALSLRSSAHTPASTAFIYILPLPQLTATRIQQMLKPPVGRAA